MRNLLLLRSATLVSDEDRNSYGPPQRGFPLLPAARRARKLAQNLVLSHDPSKLLAVIPEEKLKPTVRTDHLIGPNRVEKFDFSSALSAFGAIKPRTKIAQPRHNQANSLFEVSRTYSRGESIRDKTRRWGKLV